MEESEGTGRGGGGRKKMGRGHRWLETPVERRRGESVVGLLGEVEGASAARHPRPLPPATSSKKQGIHRSNFRSKKKSVQFHVSCARLMHLCDDNCKLAACNLICKLCINESDVHPISTSLGTVEFILYIIKC
jgi:hypothetical protein